MADQDPVLKPRTQDQSIENLLNKDSRLMRNPVLWFVLLAIPILVAFYIGLMQQAPAVTEAPAVVEYTPAEPAPAAEPLPESPISGTPEGRAAGKRDALPGVAGGEAQGSPRGGVICGYQDWVGKTADSALEDQLKADGHAYRILPPGSMSTMDYSQDRLNFDVDAGKVITRVWCG